MPMPVHDNRDINDFDPALEPELTFSQKIKKARQEYLVAGTQALNDAKAVAMADVLAHVRQGDLYFSITCPDLPSAQFDAFRNWLELDGGLAVQVTSASDQRDRSTIAITVPVPPDLR